MYNTITKNNIKSLISNYNSTVSSKISETSGSPTSSRMKASSKQKRSSVSKNVTLEYNSRHLKARTNPETPFNLSQPVEMLAEVARSMARHRTPLRKCPPN